MVKLTLPEKLPRLVTVMVELPELPLVMERKAGFAVILNKPVVEGVVKIAVSARLSGTEPPVPPLVMVTQVFGTLVPVQTEPITYPIGVPLLLVIPTISKLASNNRPVVGATDMPPTERKAKVVVPLPSQGPQPMFPGVPAANPTPLFTQLAGLAVKNVPGRVGTIFPSTVALSGCRTLELTWREIEKPFSALEL